MLSSSTFGLLVQFAGGSSGKGVITMIVVDSSGQPVQGATASTSPSSTVKYSDGSGYPTATSGTNTNGIAFMVNVPPGDVSVSASKSGMTFKSHTLNARADKFTTTAIAP
jgi:hypothetical protein